MSREEIVELINIIEKFEVLAIEEFAQYVQDYNMLINKMITDNCKSTRAFTFYNQNYNSALQEARVGNLVRAEYLIDRAKVFIGNRQLDDKELDIYKIISFPIEAYIKHKKGEFANSLSQLVETMNLHEIYCSDYPFLIFHKIQQIHNVIRILFKQRDYRQACSLIEDILSFLVLGKEFEFNGIQFKAIKDIASNINMKLSMIEQVFFESLSVSKHLNEEYRLSIESSCYQVFLVNDGILVDKIRNWIFVFITVKDNILNCDKDKVLSVFKNFGNDLGNFAVYQLFKATVYSVQSLSFDVDFTKCENILIKFDKPKYPINYRDLKKIVS